MSNVKAIREAKGISQKVLAASAQISAPFLHDLENGNRNAKPETWRRIAEALGCSVTDLVKEKET